MKKRFLPLCLATSTLLTIPTTSTATFHNENPERLRYATRTLPLTQTTSAATLNHATMAESTPETNTSVLEPAAMPKPLIELEAMKMFCTVNVDLSHSNTQIAQDIESILSSMNWVIRLHPDADNHLQNRFEEVLQLVANNLGRVIGTFEPQIVTQGVEETQFEEEPLIMIEDGGFDYGASIPGTLYAAQGVEESLLKDKPVLREKERCFI
ncbi:MAG TPA: hypothetical protein DD412_02695 [Holosporales bacterium]|nr:hypothetical protein [Holosporales bacterium]